MADIGALSTLGLGSNGALSYDIIDKLKAVDQDAIIKPLDKKIENSQNRELVFQDIVTMLNNMEASLFELAGPILYDARSVDVTGSDISATVLDGAAVQEVDIQVKQLAKTDIKQTKGFATTDTVVTNTDTDMTITINGVDTTFTVTAGTTLTELKDQINSAMGGQVNVTLLNTGAATDPYRLILKTTETGANQAMSFSFSNNNDFLDLTATSASLQDAQDAIINVDGVDITRSSNTISDAISGVTLTLNSVSTSTNHLSITQDNEGIADKVQAFVDQYNELTTKLSNVTKYDPETKETGVFQGDSTIEGIKRKLTTIVSEIAPNGKILANFGIEVDKDGVMSFNRSTFINALGTDTETIKATFAGDTTAPGIFADLKNYLADATKFGGTLSKYDQYLKDTIQSLEDQKTKALERINNKYTIMAKQFMAYDSIIAKMNASFNSLSMIINAQIYNKK